MNWSEPLSFHLGSKESSSSLPSSKIFFSCEFQKWDALWVLRFVTFPTILDLLFLSRVPVDQSIPNSCKGFSRVRFFGRMAPLPDTRTTSTNHQYRNFWKFSGWFFQLVKMVQNWHHVVRGERRSYDTGMANMGMPVTGESVKKTPDQSHGLTFCGTKWEDPPPVNILLVCLHVSSRHEILRSKECLFRIGSIWVQRHENCWTDFGAFFNSLPTEFSSQTSTIQPPPQPTVKKIGEKHQWTDCLVPLLLLPVTATPALVTGCGAQVADAVKVRKRHFKHKGANDQQQSHCTLQGGCLIVAVVRVEILNWVTYSLLIWSGLSHYEDRPFPSSNKLNLAKVLAASEVWILFREAWCSLVLVQNSKDPVWAAIFHQFFNDLYTLIHDGSKFMFRIGKFVGTTLITRFTELSCNSWNQRETTWKLPPGWSLLQHQGGLSSLYCIFFRKRKRKKNQKFRSRCFAAAITCTTWGWHIPKGLTFFTRLMASGGGGGKAQVSSSLNHDLLQLCSFFKGSEVKKPSCRVHNMLWCHWNSKPSHFDSAL